MPRAIVADAAMSTRRLGRVRKIAVVYNARSGALSSDSEPPLEDRLSDLLARHGVDPVLVPFEPSTVREDVHTLLAGTPPPDAVIVAGGDGTVRSVAAHILGSDVPLGVLPMGTMNVLARDLGVPEDLESALDALLTAPVQLIDVARVNGELFLCSSALAMMPHLGRIRERARGAPGWQQPRWWARGLRIWRRYPRMRLHVIVDGNEHQVRTRAMVVSNNPLSSRPASGLSARLPGRDRLDTGRLVVYVIRDRTRWDLLSLAAKLPDGSWLTDRRLSSYEGSTVQVRSSQVGVMSVMSDGEVVQLPMPLRYELVPRALAILTPRAGMGAATGAGPDR
jgi:diacylglycerol kinase family enzyme